MGKIIELLKKQKHLVSDGAWGTFLQAKGMQAGTCPELWNIDHPEAVSDIARSYLEAGADMTETNSFGGNSCKLAHYGLSGQAYEINRSAAALSRQAAGPDKIVLGSVGPTGKFLMMGDLSSEEMFEVFYEQCQALKDGGADAIVVETMTDLEEAVIAVRAAAKTGLDVLCTMTFDPLVGGGYRTMMGVSPSDMIQPLIEAGASVVGSNCGNGSKGMIDIVREIRSVNTEIPILIQSNAGLPVFKDGQTLFPESPEEMAASVPGLMEAGANIIGGCCGSTPAHIRAIAARVRKYPQL